MQLDRVKELAKQYGKTVRVGSDQMYDLYDEAGKYVDSLHPGQVEELHEDDFIEFYLED